MTARSSKSGYHTVTPFLLCHRVAAVIEFLSSAFDAHEIARIVGDRGEVLHAEVQLGDSKILMGEPDPKIKRLKATEAHHYVFVSDIQASYQRALMAGGTSFSKPVGPRLGAVRDPGGNFWWIGRKELVSPALLKRRNAAFLKKQARR
jgi:PhnB protein